jgi:hypothetical protein
MKNPLVKTTHKEFIQLSLFVIIFNLLFPLFTLILSKHVLFVIQLVFESCLLLSESFNLLIILQLSTTKYYIIYLKIVDVNIFRYSIQIR